MDAPCVDAPCVGCTDGAVVTMHHHVRRPDAPSCCLRGPRNRGASPTLHPRSVDGDSRSADMTAVSRFEAVSGATVGRGLLTAAPADDLAAPRTLVATWWGFAVLAGRGRAEIRAHPTIAHAIPAQGIGAAETASDVFPAAVLLALFAPVVAGRECRSSFDVASYRGVHRESTPPAGAHPEGQSQAVWVHLRLPVVRTLSPGLKEVARAGPPRCSQRPPFRTRVSSASLSLPMLLLHWSWRVQRTR